MTVKHTQAYADPKIAGGIIRQIKAISRRPIRLMEVCGTHTVSIFRSGIRSLLPETITLLSGPGCPVCVTAQKEIDAFIALAGIDDVIVATFGDLLRVPGSRSSLQQQKAAGRDVRLVYSPLDALDIARRQPGRPVVFLGVGFETTAPTIAAVIRTAREARLDNFSVFSAHKLVPPALAALLEAGDVRLDGFILPGHVSVIIGVKAYRPVVEKYHLPCVVAGFEPLDILHAILMLVRQIESHTAQLENGYPRAVAFNGNPRARAILNEVFEVVDAPWRGLGTIAASGLRIKEAFAAYDAQRVFAVNVPEAVEPAGCACGEVLKGVKTPPECPLFKKACTPTNPVGPCMVSSEGSCAAFYRYHTH